LWSTISLACRDADERHVPLRYSQARPTYETGTTILMKVAYDELGIGTVDRVSGVDARCGNRFSGMARKEF
jgi:hypothetical protein